MLFIGHDGTLGLLLPVQLCNLGKGYVARIVAYEHAGLLHNLWQLDVGDFLIDKAGSNVADNIYLLALIETTKQCAKLCGVDLICLVQVDIESEGREIILGRIVSQEVNLPLAGKLNLINCPAFSELFKKNVVQLGGFDNGVVVNHEFSWVLLNVFFCNAKVDL